MNYFDPVKCSLWFRTFCIYVIGMKIAENFCVFERRLDGCLLNIGRRL